MVDVFVEWLMSYVNHEDGWSLDAVINGLDHMKSNTYDERDTFIIQEARKQIGALKVKKSPKAVVVKQNNKFIKNSMIQKKPVVGVSQTGSESELWEKKVTDDRVWKLFSREYSVFARKGVPLILWGKVHKVCGVGHQHCVYMLTYRGWLYKVWGEEKPGLTGLVEINPVPLSLPCHDALYARYGVWCKKDWEELKEDNALEGSIQQHVYVQSLSEYLHIVVMNIDMSEEELKMFLDVVKG